MRSLEFLYFYLMPEAGVSPMASASAPNTAILHREADKHISAFAGHARTHSSDSMVIDYEDTDMQTQNEKQQLLGQYLSNVSELVADLQDTAPFSVTA